jgi:co-chaperonin GroES (HSP10)
MVPLTYGSVQMMASWEGTQAAREKRLAERVAHTVFAERDRPKRRYHPMKEILMLQPRGPRLLVKRIDAPKPTSSTIIIPETVDGEKSCYALVLAVGNKVVGDVKVADTVILARYCGSPVEVELDGETLEAQIVMEDDVLAVVA